MRLDELAKQLKRIQYAKLKAGELDSVIRFMSQQSRLSMKDARDAFLMTLNETPDLEMRQSYTTDSETGDPIVSEAVANRAMELASNADEWRAILSHYTRLVCVLKLPEAEAWRMLSETGSASMFAYVAERMLS
jgi:hypothetical protein